MLKGQRSVGTPSPELTKSFHLLPTFTRETQDRWQVHVYQTEISLRVKEEPF